MKTAVLLLFLFVNILAPYNSLAQSEPLVPIERGSLLLNEHPQVLDSFVNDGRINLKYVRSIGHFLTNNDITVYKKVAISRRSNASIRHIKHLIEKQEENYQDNELVNDATREIFYELYLFNESLKQKSIANAKTKISFNDKIKMEVHSFKSKRVFRYKNSITDHEAKNVNKNNLQEDPKDSPFWHKKTKQVPLDKRFAQLARSKKIKSKKEMVVLFDKPSLSGSAPKINVLDLDLDNKWSLKWGDEVHTDVVGSHIFAALGYDVDHPYYYEENKLTLIFDELKEIKNKEELKIKIKEIYKIDLDPFITTYGTVTIQMTQELADLQPYVGKQFVRFKKCVLEARPDRVKRMGSFLPGLLSNEDRRELRGALLAHQFIGNWDTREQNTLLTSVHMGNYKYRMSAVFSDLGASFGVVQGIFPPDFKVGLVNEFSWEVASYEGGILKLNSSINSILPPYKQATYQDLLWMAKKISELDGPMLRNMINKAKWPPPIAELYFHKLASRRASILKAFDLTDPHPIAFDKNLTIKMGEEYVVKNGELLIDIDKNKNPESFLSKKGRLTNYGH
ncbi:MAG: hypothetical protein V4547_09470 [Bacteroidota bacterium]